MSHNLVTSSKSHPIHLQQAGTIEKELISLSTENAKKYLEQPCPDYYGRTVLHYCCATETNNFESIKCLLEYGANPNSVSSPADDKRTPLHCAILRHPNNIIEVVNLLLAYGADPKKADSQILTPIDYANNKQNKQLIGILKKASEMIKFSREASEKEGHKIHKDVTEKINQKQIMDLLSKFVFRSLTPFDYDGISLLNNAICSENYSLASELAKYTLEIPTGHHPSGFSPLHLLTRYNNPALFKTILERFPRLVLHRDSINRIPLHMTCGSNLLDLTKLQCEGSQSSIYIKCNATDKHGQTALHYAAEEGHIDVVRYLLELTLPTNNLSSKKVNPLLVDKSKSTFILVAIRSKHKDIIELVVNKYPHIMKSLVNVQNEQGKNILQYVVAYDWFELTTILLEKFDAIPTKTAQISSKSYIEFSKLSFNSPKVKVFSDSLVISGQMPPSASHVPEFESSQEPGSQRVYESRASLSSHSFSTASTQDRYSNSTSFNSSLVSNISETGSQTNSYQEHYFDDSTRRRFNSTCEIVIFKSLQVSILMESILQTNSKIFNYILNFAINNDIIISNFQDYNLVISLLIRLEKWRELTLLLRARYNKRIINEISWQNMYLTNDVMATVLQDLTQFIFLTDTSVSMHDVSVFLFNSNEFTSIPEFIFRLPIVYRLEISQNCITVISPETFILPQLKTLILNSNPLSNWKPVLALDIRSLLSESTITELELSNCEIFNFPAIVQLLPALKYLNISKNNLRLIPNFIWKLKSLRTFDISFNKLKHLSFENLKPIQKRIKPPAIQTQYNPRPNLKYATLLHGSDSLLTKSVQKASLERAEVSINLDETNEIEQSFITDLNLSHNDFVLFPSDIGCLVPSLKRLNISYNQITELNLPVVPYPILMLNLSYNMLHTITEEYPALISPCANNSENHINTRRKSIISRKLSQHTICRHREHDALNWIKELFLEGNQLTEFQIIVNTSSLHDSVQITHGGRHEVTVGSSMRLLYPVLETLDLKKNNLITLTPDIRYLPTIQEIALSNNSQFTTLPYELGYLKPFNLLKTILVDDCPKLKNVPSHLYYKNSIDTSRLLPYYRAQIKGSVKSNIVKLMVIGSFSQGKTSLLRRLKGLPLTQRITTEGVDVDTWKCDAGRGRSIIFVTWDFAGQEEYYATHQCFLSTEALYILCFSLEDYANGSTTLNVLITWLQSVALRVPKSPVIIVGTHLDKVSDDVARNIEESINNRFIEYPKKGDILPSILGVITVSCIYSNNNWFSPMRKKMESLKDQILHIVTHLELSYDKARQNISYVYKANFNEDNPRLLLNQETPKDYEALRETLAKARKELLMNSKPPILKDSELKFKAQNIFDNPDDLNDAINHLNMQGSLLHFNTPLLKDVYFLDPNWLCKQMALVIGAHTETNLSNGILHLSSLKKALLQMECSEYWSKFIQLLEQFQVMNQFTNEKVLIPSQLPEKPQEVCGYYQKMTDNTNNDSNITNNIFFRMWPMNCIPYGFWSRLLCRIALDPVILSRASQKSDAKVSLLSLEDASLTLNSLRNSIKDPENNYDLHWNLWRSGIQLIDNEGNLFFEMFELKEENSHLGESVLNIDENSRNEELGYFHYLTDTYRLLCIVHIRNEINCDNKTLAAQLFVRISQHVNSLFEAWFPGIKQDEDIPNYYVCPKCISEEKNSEMLSINSYNEWFRSFNYKSNQIVTYYIQFGSRPYWSCFLEKDCFKHISNNFPVYCISHGEIDINCMAPDITMHDVGQDRIMKVDQVHVDQANQLGAGTFGAVYRGTVFDKLSGEDLPCAVKVFASCCSEISYDQLIKDISSDSKLWDSYKELRKELSPMVHLNHENLSLLIGVTRIPLQMIMGLAKKGSLSNTIKKYSEKQRTFDPIVIAKCIYQIASGLSYLHSNKLVHLDLKPGNILVWDFPDPNEKDCSVHLKLADYGTVLHCDSLGVKMSGLMGTPGYIAPEVVLYSGKQSFTSKADVFSFAMVLYEIISFRQPFVNFDNEHDIKWAPTQGLRPQLIGKEKFTPLLFQDLMTACWEADPDKRPTMIECAKVADNPMFEAIRIVMSFEELNRFACAVMISNKPKSRTVNRNRFGSQVQLEKNKNSFTESCPNNFTMGRERKEPTNSKNLDECSLDGEQTQIWLGGLSNPHSSKIAVVQFLHSELGSRFWFLPNVLHEDSMEDIITMTSVDDLLWIGTNSGKLVIIDPATLNRLSLVNGQISSNSIHSLLHAPKWKCVFVSFRYEELMIFNDKLEESYSSILAFKLICQRIIHLVSPIYSLHLVQISESMWEVWGTKDNLSIEYFSSTREGNIFNENFSKTYSTMSFGTQQRFHCLAPFYYVGSSNKSRRSFSVVWLSEWARSTLYVLGGVSKTLRSCLVLPQDGEQLDSILEVHSMHNTDHIIYIGVNDGRVFEYEMVTRDLIRVFKLHQSKVRSLLILPNGAFNCVCIDQDSSQSRILVSIGNGFNRFLPNHSKNKDLSLVAIKLN